MSLVNPFAYPQNTILSANLVNAAAYDAAVLADSPEVFWKMNEASGLTAADSSGNGRDGTYGSAVTVGGAGLFGGADKCPSFVANDDNSVVTSGYATDLTTACTLEFIVTVDPFADQSTLAAYLLNKRGGGGSPATNFPIYSARGLAANRLIFAIDSGNDIDTSDQVITSSPICQVNGTFHVANVYRDSGLCEIYVNGIQRGSATIAFTIASNALNWAFGRASGIDVGVENVTSFKGRAGRAAIYSSALSAAQIMTHFDAAVTP